MILNLSDVIGSKVEKRVDDMLSSYSCPLNPDVEYFLKSKAKEFARQRIASTYLILASYKDEPASSKRAVDVCLTACLNLV